MASESIPIFGANVIAGRLEFHDKALLQRWVRSLDGSIVDVRIERHKNRRSLDQNAWIWGVAYPAIADAIGYERDEIEDLHYALVTKWGGEHFDKRMGAMVPNKRSSKLTTREFSDYMEWLVRFGAQECGGLYIALPDEEAA